MKSVLEEGFETIKMHNRKGADRAGQVVKPCNWAHLTFNRQRESVREREVILSSQSRTTDAVAACSGNDHMCHCL